MNPTTGILYIIDGTVKCAEREMPESGSEKYYKGYDHFERESAQLKYESWQESCKDVVGAHVSQHPIEGFEEITIMKPVFQIVESGQKCLKVPEGDGVRVIKLL